MTGLLHLVRHGQTTANVARALDTRPPGAVLLSSVARRAQQTAGFIGAAWDVPVEVVDGVHEVQAGDLEGLADDASMEAFRDVVRSWYFGDLGAALPGGESAHDLLERYLPVVDEVRSERLADGDVYLVSHGAAIRLVGRRLSGVDGAYAHRHALPNTGEIVLRPIDDGAWELVSWADAPSHLDPMG